MSLELTTTSPGAKTAALRLYYRRNIQDFFSSELSIRTKGIGIAPFVPNVVQAPILQGMEEQLKQTGKIRALIFKCRQPGISTLASGIIWHKTALYPGVNSFIVAQDKTTVSRIFGMHDLFYKRMNPQIRPTRRYFTKGTMITLGDEAEGITSDLLVGEAKNINLGVGSTIHALHLSEIARYPSEASLTESLFPACSDYPGTVRIIESTAHFGGCADYFRDQCERSMNRPTSEWRYFFVEWWKMPEYSIPLRPKERLRPDQHSEYPHEKILMKKLGLTVENLKWRRSKIDEYRGDVDLFYLSYPTCIAGDVRIGTDLGLIPISEARTASETSDGKITNWLDNGQREIVEIESWCGYRLRCTRDHRLKTASGDFKSLDQGLSVGDGIQLQIPRLSSQYYEMSWKSHPGVYSTLKVDETMGRFLGYYLADGSYNGKTVEIAVNAKDQDVVEDAGRILNLLAGGLNFRTRIDDRLIGRHGMSGAVGVRSNAVSWKETLSHLGVAGNVSSTGRTRRYVRIVTMPEAIWRSPKSVVREFLSALFESDGMVNYNYTLRVGLGMTQEVFVRDVQTLLLAFGIVCRLRQYQPKVKTDQHKRKKVTYLYMDIVNSKRFYDRIGFISERKNRIANLGWEKLGPPRGRPRNPFTLIDKMVSIKNCGDSPVYDITIDPSHCFDANGFAVHNCFTEAWITKEAAAFPYGRLNEQQAYLKDPIQRYKIVEGKMFRDDEGELWIWKIPEKDRLYDIGADVAGGDSSTSGLDNQKQGDFSVAEVVERGSLEQCAEWRGHVLPREFGDILAAIGRFYNDAQIASEVNSFGISTLERLQKVYRNLYLWRKRDTVGVKFTGKFGWQTNYESKNLMVNLLREKLYYQQVVIHSRVLWNELRNFCRDFTPTGQITYCAATGYDDCCFLPGTKITTNPGLKAIEDIQERSHVLTHEGRYRPVSTLMQRQYCGRIRQLKVVGLYDSVSLTDNHPVLVRRNENAQWINARDLKVGDPVLCPKRKNLRPSIFNEDQLWVMGWYLAEGWLTSPPHKGNYRVEFEMHINEEQIARRIADVLVKYDPPDPTFQFVKGKSRSRRLNKVYRSPPRIHKRSDRPNSITLAYSSRYWAQIFEEHCGSGARTKELSDELFLSSGLIPLARGYIEGDGHQAFDGRVHCLSVCSSSEKLIWQIRQILIDHGVWCKIYQPRKVAGQFLSYGKLTNANPSWSLHISKEYFGLFGESTKIHPVISQHHLFRTKETDDGFWPKIRTINDSDYDGLVHNMEVAEDHSYIAGGIAVHNCIAYMIALQTSEDENLDGLYGSVRQKPEEDAKGPVIDAAFTDQKFKDDFNFTPDETLKVDTGNWR